MSKGRKSRAWNVNININMGITNLFPFIKTVTIAANLNSFAGKIAAVDASCWMHKGLAISLKEFGDDRRSV